MTPILGIMASQISGKLNNNSYESIATLTGTGNPSTLTFSSIPSTYKSLQIRGITSNDQTSPPATSSITMGFNSDTAANYSHHRLSGDGSAASAAGTASTSSIVIPFFQAASIAAINNTMGAFVVDIIDYASTSKYKTIRALSGVDFNGTYNGVLSLSSGSWRSTSAIDSITLTGYQFFSTKTTFALYGIKG
jgi:hypothetical protein